MRSNFTTIFAKVKQQLAGVIPEDVVDKDPWLEGHTRWVHVNTRVRLSRNMPGQGARNSGLFRIFRNHCAQAARTRATQTHGAQRELGLPWFHEIKELPWILDDIAVGRRLKQLKLTDAGTREKVAGWCCRHQQAMPIKYMYSLQRCPSMSCRGIHHSRGSQVQGPSPSKLQRS